MAFIIATASEMRRMLVAEGVFKNAGSVDESTLYMFWIARKSPEYTDRSEELVHSVRADEIARATQSGGAT